MALSSRFCSAGCSRSPGQMGGAIVADLMRRTSLALLLLATVTAGCELELLRSDGNERSQNAERVRELWDHTVSQYLMSKLWRQPNVYDAPHMLMLPMEFALRGDNDRLARDFHDFFQRFEAAAPLRFDDNPLRRIQFEYWVSRYLRLSQGETGWQRRLLEDRLESLRRHWLEEPAPHWAYSSDFPSARKRLLWKLDRETTGFRYFRAVIDEEYYVFTTAAELAIALDQRGRQRPDFVRDLLSQAYRTFREQGAFSDDGRWLMQPGVWSDHKDYRYAGHPRLAPGLEPRVVPGIAMDVSHSHRMPLWLDSLALAAPTPEEGRFFSRVRNGFERQFRQKAWVPATPEFPVPRLTNYLDGHNGIYRYGYATAGDNLGYGPYELSGAFVWGWYGVLGGPELTQGRRRLLEQMPLSGSVLATYVGPNTSRDRHPLVTWPDYYQNGFAELHLRLGLLLNE